MLNCLIGIIHSTVHTIKSLRFFIGFLDVLGPKTSKKPIKKRNDLVVGTVTIIWQFIEKSFIITHISYGPIWFCNHSRKPGESFLYPKHGL